jgi:DNA-directed RNA polymerase specialized sigma24 family protein
MPEVGQQAKSGPGPQIDNLGLTLTTEGCHTCPMAKYPESPAEQETFRRLKEVRAQALEHFKMARLLHSQRRDLIRSLTEDGFSQADIAREMGVTRQAIQKMLA